MLHTCTEWNFTVKLPKRQGNPPCSEQAQYRKFNKPTSKLDILVKCLNVCLLTKWLCVRILFQSVKLLAIHKLRKLTCQAAANFDAVLQYLLGCLNSRLLSVETCESAPKKNIYCMHYQTISRWVSICLQFSWYFSRS